MKKFEQDPRSYSQNKSYIIHNESHITRHTSYIIDHTSQIIHNTPSTIYVTCFSSINLRGLGKQWRFIILFILKLTSHITHIVHHTSHTTHHTSHINNHTSGYLSTTNLRSGEGMLMAFNGRCMMYLCVSVCVCDVMKHETPIVTPIILFLYHIIGAQENF